jgi:hypothetical protein
MSDTYLLDHVYGDCVRTNSLLSLGVTRLTTPRTFVQPAAGQHYGSPIDTDHHRVSLYSAEFAADPHRAYQEMRSRYGSLVPVDLAPGVPATLVIGYRTAVRILHDPEHFPADGVQRQTAHLPGLNRGLSDRPGRHRPASGRTARSAIGRTGERVILAPRAVPPCIDGAEAPTTTGSAVERALRSQGRP